MNRLDPRLPLVINTRDLGRRPGSMIETSLTVEAPEDLGSDVIAVVPGQPIELDLRLESVVEGVLVTGSAQASANGVCVRCLDPLDQPVDVSFQELFAYADRVVHHQQVDTEDGADELHELDGDLFDLEPVLRDAVVLSLPFQPVCRDDCPGLCSECGAHLAGDPEHDHEVLDPRWAALQSIAASSSSPRSPRNTEQKRN